ncbi:Protein kinase-like domain [Pseudocohnilembus persalinus]|uniref:non-specific serine/threonine protein kinase n=1 Tax=Pseudocohnilembus persalinus TaxID=266149 RepID=A0A0V0Q7R1_PSEPJ|nr:Protein kinase-like domain [Pseudocohnilembus persalinus]|eukprot:KRW98268.1 Protein kinase-like domain [Pseudocohnilembus persalinus]
MSAKVLEQYQIIAQIPSGYVLMKKDQQQIAVFKVVHSPLSVENQQKILEKRFQVQHPYILNIVDFQITENTQNGTKTNFIYEGWNMDLEEDIQARQTNSDFYEEDMLMNLFYMIIQGVTQLHNKNLVHGDLKSNNIALTENGQIKIIDQWGFGDAFFKSKQQICLEKNSYLSPEVFYQINSEQQNTVVDSDEFKIQNFNHYATKPNDIFAIGLIFLELSNLNNCLSLYDYDNNYFNSSLLQEEIKKLKNRYSRNLSSIIVMMCDENPETRPEIQQIYQFIQSNWSVQENPNNNEQNYQNQYLKQSQQNISHLEKTQHSQQDFNSTANFQQHQQFQQEQKQKEQIQFNEKSQNFNQIQNISYNSQNSTQANYQNYNSQSHHLTPYNNNSIQNYNSNISNNYSQNTQNRSQTQNINQSQQYNQSQSQNQGQNQNNQLENTNNLSSMLEKCLNETRTIIAQNQKRKQELQESYRNSVKSIRESTRLNTSNKENEELQQIQKNFADQLSTFKNTKQNIQSKIQNSQQRNSTTQSEQFYLQSQNKTYNQNTQNQNQNINQEQNNQYHANFLKQKKQLNLAKVTNQSNKQQETQENDTSRSIMTNRMCSAWCFIPK